jgi:predicted RNase H-like HicB family nuclease
LWYTIEYEKYHIIFQISESDGGYVAEGVSVPIVTQGETLDELTANIREAVGLYGAFLF